MCCNSNLFYVSYFNFLCNYLLKFVVHEMNPEMFKSEMMILTEREDWHGWCWCGCVLDIIDWCSLLLKRWWSRERADMTCLRKRLRQPITGLGTWISKYIIHDVFLLRLVQTISTAAFQYDGSFSSAPCQVRWERQKARLWRPFDSMCTVQWTATTAFGCPYSN
jgi:hypothetical protein